MHLAQTSATRYLQIIKLPVVVQNSKKSAGEARFKGFLRIRRIGMTEGLKYGIDAVETARQKHARIYWVCSRGNCYQNLIGRDFG
jgi:hypothetical protein